MQTNIVHLHDRTSRFGGDSTGRYVALDGLKTYVETAGNQGESVVLLHSGYATAIQWRHQIPALGEHFRVSLPERRGHGRTPDSEGSVSFEAGARETIAFLELPEVGPSHLIGHSDGAIIGVLVAIARPDLVNKLDPMGVYVNRAGIRPYLESPGLSDLHQAPLHISLFLMASTEERGRVLNKEGPNVRRETFVSLSFFQSSDGALGKIELGGDRQFTPGKWIKFSPAFVALVVESFANLPAVTPIAAPPHEYRPAPGNRSRYSILARAVARTYGIALAGIFVILVLLVRLSRRVVNKELRKHQKIDIGAA